MKAIVYSEYGPPENLRLEEIEKPSPAEGEVLVKVHAASVNRADWEGLIGKPLYARIRGWRRPRHTILGTDVAGRVEAVGKSVTRFQPGDAVFGDIIWPGGSFAEYVCIREKRLVPKPEGLTFEQASTIPAAGVIALQGIRDKGEVRAGQRVLINGAGGSTGIFAIQLAKLYGAEVTAVDRTAKHDYMRSLGADHVIDYMHQDFTRPGNQYDMILDVMAYRSVFAYARALRPGGRCLVVGGSVPAFLLILVLGPLVGRLTRKRVQVLAVQSRTKDILHVAELCEAGKIVPVIDRCYPLEETAEALRALGEGRVKGKVVITPAQHSEND